MKNEKTHLRGRRAGMSRAFVIAMLVGAVGLATGYAKLSGGRGGQGGEHSAAFKPEPAAESEATQAQPEAQCRQITIADYSTTGNSAPDFSCISDKVGPLHCSPYRDGCSIGSDLLDLFGT